MMPDHGIFFNNTKIKTITTNKVSKDTSKAMEELTEDGERISPADFLSVVLGDNGTATAIANSSVCEIDN